MMNMRVLLYVILSYISIGMIASFIWFIYNHNLLFSLITGGISIYWIIVFSRFIYLEWKFHKIIKECTQLFKLPKSIKFNYSFLKNQIIGISTRKHISLSIHILYRYICPFHSFTFKSDNSIITVFNHEFAHIINKYADYDLICEHIFNNDEVKKSKLNKLLLWLRLREYNVLAMYGIKYDEWKMFGEISAEIISYWLHLKYFNIEYKSTFSTKTILPYLNKNIINKYIEVAYSKKER